MQKSFITLTMILFFAVLINAQELQIHHINVGQGDATLIISPTGKRVLIDAGNTGMGTNVVRPYLSSLSITYLDFVVCSHYHADHLGGLDEVINGLGTSNIGAVYDRGRNAPLPSTTAFTEYENAANATGRRYAIQLGQVIDLGDGVTMKCVATDGYVINYGRVTNATSNENCLTVGWLINYNSFQYFTGGDLGGETTYYADNETPLAPQVGNVDAFKINHHGSQYSTNQTFVNTLKAETGFICVGSNTYGHPTQVVLDRLANANCYMYLTQAGSGGTIPSGKGVVANNHIVIRTTGKSYTVTYGGTTHSYPGDGTRNYAPTSVTVSSGTINSGSASNLSANDESYLVVNSTTTSTYTTDWYSSVTISENRASVSKLTVTYDGKYSRSVTQKLYLFNYTTNAWNQIDNRTVGTTDVTITYTPTTPSNFISTTGIIRLRVQGTTTAGTFTCSGDFVRYAVTTGIPKLAFEEFVPTDIQLFQNYPNPFNPSTIINYWLSVDNFVSLKVYDVLGREVATLVDEFKPAGYYEVNFDASNLSSGVYLYKLSVGNFTEVKKMLLTR